ncbi:hypothetical protein KCU98_g2655, partial [Aureobasidium melanogenum]
MSGYLPPHYGPGEGLCSEIYKAEYDLKSSDISGGTEEIKDYWLAVPQDVVPTINTLVTLAPTTGEELIKVQPLGFGLWGWGDVLTYGWGPSSGYDQKLNDESIHGAWKAIFQRSTNVLLDTAEHYGYTDGYSEKKVGDFFCEDQDAGTLDRSRVVLATNPIALGRLTGKYDRHNRPRGNRNFGNIDWDKIQPIVDELKRIGAKVNKSPTAVALNWVICKGAIPIPTVKNREQVVDCLQALGWRLDKDDENRLDVLGVTNSPDYHTLQHFQNWWWQQG